MADMSGIRKQISREMALTPEEIQEFLELVVNHLAMCSGLMWAENVSVDSCERKEFVEQTSRHSEEFDRLLGGVSPKVVNAMIRYLEFELAQSGLQFEKES